MTTNDLAQIQPEKYHGKLGGYTNHGCLCDLCRAAHAAYQGARRDNDTYREWNKLRGRRYRLRKKSSC